NSAGTAVTTLFREDKPAGSQSFVFTAAGVPDGNYTIRLTAHDGYGRTAKASVAIVVSETLLRFATDTKVVSPNGDGRRDAASFTVALAQPANVSLALAARGLSIPLFQLALQPGEQQWRWTGLAADG